MGAWGYGAFENDTASDWAGGLTRHSSLDWIKFALAQALKPGFVGHRDGSHAVAACEVLARLGGLNGGYVTSYTHDVDEWVAANPMSVPVELYGAACLAIDKVKSDESELAEEWEESDEWLAALDELRGRLASLQSQK